MPSVFGLGNPGERYARTRHNVGFRVVEELARRWSAEPGAEQPDYRWWRAERRGRRVFLVTPRTFMNRSGEALRAWRSSSEEPEGAEGLLVVADDVYLPLGMVRLRTRGGNGGHRGLASIEEELGGGEYARLRLGVGATESARLRDHVLEEFEEAEEEEAARGIATAADAVECWVDEGPLVAMNRFNRRIPKEVSEP